MLDLHKQNAHFNALDGLLHHQIAYLLAEGRVASTLVSLSQEEALDVIGLAALDTDFSRYPDQRAWFSGYIITREPLFTVETPPHAMHPVPEASAPAPVRRKRQGGWDEAHAIAQARGWGEAIDGCILSIRSASAARHEEDARRTASN